MNIEEFRKKYDQAEITDYIHELDYIADHDDSEFYRDMYWLMVGLFPDCDPYKRV